MDKMKYLGVWIKENLNMQSNLIKNRPIKSSLFEDKEITKYE